MYIQRGAQLTAKEILAKLNNPDYKPEYKPVVYALSDIRKAKQVLTRILDNASFNEIRSIKESITKNREL